MSDAAVVCSGSFMPRPLSLSLAWVFAATTARAQAPEPVVAEALEAARQLFFEAYAAGERGRWEDAYRGFSRAMAVRASPAVRFNLAIAARNTGRFVEALDQFRTFLREGAEGADAPRRAAATREVETLTTRVSRLTVPGSKPSSSAMEMARWSPSGSRRRSLWAAWPAPTTLLPLPAQVGL